MSDRSSLIARVGPSDRHGRALVTVEADGDRVAWVEVARHRRVLAATTDPRKGPNGARLVPDPGAWTDQAAQRAARRRWRDRHRGIRTVWRIGFEPDGSHTAAEVLEAAGTALAASGVRRLDVRIGARDPIATSFQRSRWVVGPVDGDVLASLAIAYPWTDALDPSSRLASALAPLPRPIQRAGRRAATFELRQVPGLVDVAWTELTGTLRHRTRAGTPRSLPAEAAPIGSHPFAASRYRTVRDALGLVPPDLRATTFLDIGCGDGRVLREALDAGFARADGRELDPALAERARRAVADRGRIEAGDALATAIPDGVGVLFLNNPFGVDAVRRFAGLVADTLAHRPRPLLVLYLNPQPIDALLGAGLALVEVNPLFSVFANQEAS